MALSFNESANLGTIGSGNYIFRHYGYGGQVTYSVLEYLYSAGNAWINTGVTGGTRAGYELGIKIETVSRAYARYFGGADLPPYPVPVNNQSSYGNIPITIGSYYNSSLHNYTIFYPSNDFRDIEVIGGSTDSNTVINLDGTQVHSTAVNQGWGTTPCYLFSTTWTGGAGACYISYCKMYTDNTLVRDFVPVQRSTGELGMYDKVTGAFYQSSGAAFTAGQATGEVIIPGQLPVTHSIVYYNLDADYRYIEVNNTKYSGSGYITVDDNTNIIGYSGYPSGIYAGYAYIKLNGTDVASHPNNGQSEQYLDPDLCTYTYAVGSGISITGSDNITTHTGNLYITT